MIKTRDVLKKHVILIMLIQVVLFISFSFNTLNSSDFRVNVMQGVFLAGVLYFLILYLKGSEIFLIYEIFLVFKIFIFIIMQKENSMFLYVIPILLLDIIIYSESLLLYLTFIAISFSPQFFSNSSLSLVLKEIKENTFVYDLTSIKDVFLYIFSPNYYQIDLKNQEKVIVPLAFMSFYSIIISFLQLKLTSYKNILINRKEQLEDTERELVKKTEELFLLQEEYEGMLSVINVSMTDIFVPFGNFITAKSGNMFKELYMHMPMGDHSPKLEIRYSNGIHDMPKGVVKQIDRDIDLSKVDDKFGNYKAITALEKEQIFVVTDRKIIFYLTGNNYSDTLILFNLIFKDNESRIIVSLFIEKRLMPESQIVDMINSVRTNFKIKYENEIKIAEYKKHSEKLKQEIQIDQLTTLFSKKMYKDYKNVFYITYIDEKIQEKAVAILFFDVDNFKSINDTYGHRKGDEVLTTIGAVIKKASREKDIGIRYGGEELILIIESVSDKVNQLEERSHEIAETIRRNFEREVFKSGNVEFSCTVSIGIAIDFNTNISFADLVDLSDKAMYVSKGRGKNRVTKWDSKAEKDYNIFKAEKERKIQNNESFR